MLPLLLVISAQGAASSPLRLELSASGFKAYYVETLASAMGVIAQWQFDAALVDTDQLGNDVTDVVRSLRDRSHIPVLAVLRSDDEDLLLKVLAAGASQVLPHPPSPRVIVAQLHRLVEVSQPRPRDDTGRVQLGPLWLDPRRAAAAVDGVDVKLTTSEFELLLLLATDAGELVHRDAISKTLRIGTVAQRRRSTDMHVCRIRRKLKAAGGERIELVTVYGQGYLLRLAPEPTTATDLPKVQWSV